MVVAYLIATGLVYGLVESGATTVSGQSTAILIVLMFGAGTDYALLIVSRYRDELRRTGDVDAAIARASERTAPAILASGGIVVAAMLVLALADFNATREMGPILALGIVVMLAAGLTLLPAAAGGARPARVLAACTRGRARSPAGRDARLGADRRARAPAPAAAGRASRSRSSPPARSGNLEGRGYLDAHRAVPRSAGVRAGAGADRQALPAGPRRAGRRRRARRRGRRDVTDAFGQQQIVVEREHRLAVAGRQADLDAR